MPSASKAKRLAEKAAKASEKGASTSKTSTSRDTAAQAMLPCPRATVSHLDSEAAPSRGVEKPARGCTSSSTAHKDDLDMGKNSELILGRLTRGRLTLLIKAYHKEDENQIESNDGKEVCSAEIICAERKL